MKAGDYANRLTWRKRTVTTDTTSGEEIESFADNGFLWCAFSTFVGRVRRDYGSDQTSADLTVRVRNYPALSALDRLYSSEWDETYVIDSIGRGDNELVCDCFVYDDLELDP